MTLTPAPIRTGGVKAATETAQIELANDGVRTADLVGELLLLQPLRTEMWSTENGDRETVIVRTISIIGDGWTDHGDLPIFWGVVRRALNEQTSSRFPWVVGRIIQRPAREGSKRNPPYVLVAPTPEEVARGNVVLAEWEAAPPRVFDSKDDDGADF